MVSHAIGARTGPVLHLGCARQVDTITRAVNLLGMQAVNDLVTATTVGRTFSGMTMQLMDMSMFWRKSVLCALLAGRIAKSCGIDDSERFFIEGLLRDIGHLVLYRTVPQQAQSALVEAGDLGAVLAEVEQSNIGCDFAEVGAELIRSWGMPTQMEQAVRHQVRPSEAGEFALHASILQLAGVDADHEGLDPKRRQERLLFDPHAITITGFSPVNLPDVLTEARDCSLPTVWLAGDWGWRDSIVPCWNEGNRRRAHCGSGTRNDSRPR